MRLPHAKRNASALLLAVAIIGSSSITVLAEDAIGPFTQAQLTAGRIAFLNNCTGCHGAFMDGGDAPALTGQNFVDDWLNKSTQQLFQFASNNMPLNNAGMLSLTCSP